MSIAMTGAEPCISPHIIYDEGPQGGCRPPRGMRGTTREYLAGIRVGGCHSLSTPCTGTHQRFALGRGYQVHLIWPTYIALTPTLDPYLYRLASSLGCAISAAIASRPQVRHPQTTWYAYL